MFTNAISSPLTPPAEYALRRLLIEVTGFSEENSKAMVSTLSTLSQMKFPADADILACMTDISECVVSCRHSEEEQKRRTMIHQLTQQLYLKGGSSCETLVQRCNISKQRVQLAYEVINVRSDICVNCVDLG